MRKIEIHLDTPAEFELGDTVADIQRRMEESEIREREEETQKQKEEARRDKTTISTEEGVAEKRARTDRSGTEMDAEVGGEAGTSQLHSRNKKGHIHLPGGLR